MAQRRLKTVLSAFLRSLQDSRELASDAHQWSTTGVAGTGVTITVARKNLLTEQAFLRSFLAWETFLEEAFLLYLMGQRPPRGRAPFRFTFPPSHKMAMEWVVPEGRDYARWTNAQEVSARAARFFREGKPFSPALNGNQNVLWEMRTLRNAVAHSSISTQEKFEKVVRDKIGTYPANLTVGGFLSATVPHSAPPVSYLDSYLDKLENAARQIVRM